MSLIATNFSFPNQTNIYRGEVRDIYVLDSKLVSVATDRLSVFGHLFKEPIPHKGQVLNLLTSFSASATADIVPNWIDYVPDPNVTIGKKCQPFDVNMVIRGALVGHAWRIYELGARTISGIELPENLQQYDLFDEPLITPSTKAQSGFEEDISASMIIEQGLMSEAEFERLSIISRQLFIRGKQIARSKGLILADTKYEFGIHDGEIYIIDEIHTPDSSRYYDAQEYESYLQNRDKAQPTDFSKEHVRQWLLKQGYSGIDKQIPPTMDDSFIEQLSKQYIHVYEHLTGQTFDYPDEAVDSSKRIEDNIQHYFATTAK